MRHRTRVAGCAAGSFLAVFAATTALSRHPAREPVVLAPVAGGTPARPVPLRLTAGAPVPGLRLPHVRRRRPDRSAGPPAAPAPTATRAPTAAPAPTATAAPAPVGTPRPVVRRPATPNVGKAFDSSG